MLKHTISHDTPSLPPSPLTSKHSIVVCLLKGMAVQAEEEEEVEEEEVEEVEVEVCGWSLPS